MINNRTFKAISILFLLLVLCAGRAQAAGEVLFDPILTYAGGSPQAVGMGDFNHDGLNDVAMTTSSELRIFHQNGAGGLGSAVTYSAGTRPESLSVGDLNNDGWDDVVVTNFDSNTISIFLQQANGTLAARITYATGTGPDAVAVGDVNGDGLDDVAVSHWNSAFIGIFTQTNSGTLNARVNYTSPQAGYDDIAIGDVNGDGLNDVVKMNGQLYANPDLSVFTQSVTGTLNSAVSYSLPGNILGHGIGVGDVTGDGKVDVVMSYGGNTPTAFIAVFAQAGNGTLQSPVSYTAYDVPEALEVADVNKDGLADVIVAHGGWDRVSVHLQQNGGTLSNYSLYGLPLHSASHYGPQALVIGDVNDDTAPDVLVANYNFGLNVLYHVPPDITAPVVNLISRANVSPTDATSVNFTVNFSEPVIGVDMVGPDFDDFALATTGVSGAAVSGVSGSGNVYTVTVNTGSESGSGTIRLDIPVSATVTDQAGNPLGNLPFTAGETYTINKKPAPFTGCANQTEIPKAECDALVALYNSTNGAGWTNHTGWLQTDTPCSWYGVYCGAGHVGWLSFTEK